MIAKGFWEKIEDLLQSAIKSFRRKTQPEAIQLVARANLQIGELYDEKGDYNLALRHAVQSLNSFRKIEDKSGIFDSNNLIANIYWRKDEIEEAKKYNEKCLKMAESQKNDNWKAIAVGTRANLLGNEDKKQQLDCYLKNLKMFEDLNGVSNVAAVCTNVAIVYSEMENYEKSYEFIKRALELSKERNAIYEIAKTKIILANIYYKDPQKPVSVDSIINCLKEALETFEKIGDVRRAAIVLNRIGNNYRSKKDFKSAIAHYQRATTIYSSLNQQSEEAKLNTKIGLCHSQLKDYTPAKSYFDNAKSYFEKNLLSGHCDIGDKLSLVEIYLIIGDYNEAFVLSNKLTTGDAEEISDVKRYVALLFSSISSVLLNTVDEAYIYLEGLNT